MKIIESKFIHATLIHIKDEVKSKDELTPCDNMKSSGRLSLEDETININY